jgi:hypothetical protein
MGSAPRHRRTLAALGVVAAVAVTALAWPAARKGDAGAEELSDPAIAEKARADGKPLADGTADAEEPEQVVAAADRGPVAVLRRRKAEVELDGNGRAVFVRLAPATVVDAALIGAVVGLKSLRGLSLAGTDADSASLGKLAGLRRLESLDLAGTAVEAGGMAHLRKLPALNSLSLAFTSVGDDGLADVAGLRGLRSLNLHGTPVTDEGLAHLRRLTDLTELVLQRTEVTDEGMAHLRGLTRLETLSLVNTAIGSDGLARLRPLGRLKHLGLSGTRVTDDGLAHLRAFPELESLSLVGTAVGNVGLKVFREDLASADPTGLTKLQTLRLSFCRGVDDVGVTNLRGLKSLQSLSLVGTKVTPRAAADLRNRLERCEVRY